MLLSSRRVRGSGAVALAALLVIAAFLLPAPASGTTGTIGTTGASGTTSAQAAHLPAVALAELPPEARHTVRLVRAGGPFPYERDGVMFGNYERVLPRHERGYYREYTVPTPGVRQRGARRIVAGRGGELYYTDDHYSSFKRIRE